MPTHEVQRSEWIAYALAEATATNNKPDARRVMPLRPEIEATRTLGWGARTSSLTHHTRKIKIGPFGIHL
ncbi:hypothetical protein [Pseudomonas arsenicoxydans]|uniref:hypothetical protein n=1 Tax=Pseudomonas arsenicoxydans TaxID=702115 RepID=UPI001ABF851F|nr:hypothetical protein [Pseudomonas arsenicoxydans]